MHVALHPPRVDGDPGPRRIDARIALAASMAFGVAMLALIALTQPALEHFDAPVAKSGALDYIWRLADPTTFSRAVAWLSYLGHQLMSWGAIAYAQRHPMRYSKTLHPVNVFALGANAAFVFWHWLQTQWTYDGLAQDVSVLTSQGSVVIMLIVILAMETPRRGLLFGKAVPFRADFMHFIRRYHGYLFSWALVYTFWYHPAVSTLGHLAGFFYMFVLLIQSSLFFTTLHVNRWWTFALEFLVLPHGVMVALMQGNGMWPMFFNGFFGIFFISQLYGLPLRNRARWILVALFIAANIVIYQFVVGSWKSAARDLLAIPLIDYLGVGIIYGLFILIAAIMRRLPGRSTPAAAAH